MCVYYVFNLAYNKKVNTITFIQKVILNIPDETPTPSKVVRVLYDINAVLIVMRKKNKTVAILSKDLWNARVG